MKKELKHLYKTALSIIRSSEEIIPMMSIFSKSGKWVAVSFPDGFIDKSATNSRDRYKQIMDSTTLAISNFGTLERISIMHEIWYAIPEGDDYNIPASQHKNRKRGVQISEYTKDGNETHIYEVVERKKIHLKKFHIDDDKVDYYGPLPDFIQRIIANSSTIYDGIQNGQIQLPKGTELTKKEVFDVMDEISRTRPDIMNDFKKLFNKNG